MTTSALLAAVDRALGLEPSIHQQARHSGLSRYSVRRCRSRKVSGPREYRGMCDATATSDAAEASKNLGQSGGSPPFRLAGQLEGIAQAGEHPPARGEALGCGGGGSTPPALLDLAPGGCLPRHPGPQVLCPSLWFTAVKR